MTGYQVINLKDTNFTKNVAKKVEGIYETIENSYRRATKITNFVLGGVEKPDRFVVFGVKDGAYFGGMGYSEEGDVMSIEITSDDMVTISTTD